MAHETPFSSEPPGKERVKEDARGAAAGMVVQETTSESTTPTTLVKAA